MESEAQVTRIQRIIYRKRLLVKWASLYGEKLPIGFRLSGYMGSYARKLLSAFQAWASLPITGQWNTVSITALEDAVRARRIVETAWAWKYPPTHRERVPLRIIVHHAAAYRATADQIHAGHLARGFSGIGYHFYVRKNGTIYRGRPIWAKGAHTLNYNNDIGICCEGNFEVDTMGTKQFGSLRWLVATVRKQHGPLALIRHKDVGATACPGKLFPWRKLVG